MTFMAVKQRQIYVTIINIIVVPRADFNVLFFDLLTSPGRRSSSLFSATRSYFENKGLHASRRFSPLRYYYFQNVNIITVHSLFSFVCREFSVETI